MAKRKAARAAGRRKARLRKASAGQARSRKASARQARRKASARPVRRKVAPKRARPRKAPAGQARKAAARRKALKRTARPAARKSSAPKASARKATARKAPAAARKMPAAARKVPALNRERRIVRDEDIVPSPPSSLDLDRSASAARSGRRELSEKFHEHTETSPAITGGDIDADWESAYSVGDEAPGGDNPTPDQDIVDDIGKALGVQYEDNEELKGEKKISDRDKKRWELDPASAEDYNEHEED
jgi:uncharacterized protein DUF6335